jgi:hypothetical protein
MLDEGRQDHRHGPRQAGLVTKKLLVGGQTPRRRMAEVVGHGDGTGESLS